MADRMTKPCSTETGAPTRARLAGVLCAGLMALAACGRVQAPGGPPVPGDVQVAKVGGEVIWASDVKRQAVTQGLIGEGEPLDTSSEQFAHTLDEVIDQKLLAREALRLKLQNDPVAKRRLAASRDKLLGDILVESTVDKAVNDTAIHNLYDEQRRLSHQSEELKGRQIVVLSQADSVAIRKLLDTGASFEALAIQRSTDQATRFNGGDLGYFTLDSMPQAYGAALKDAKPGQTVGPFQSDAGWVIMHVEDRRAEQPISLEDARPQIVRFLTYDEIRNLLTRLRTKTKVDVLISRPAEAPGAPREPAGAPPAAFKQPLPPEPTAAATIPTPDQASEGGAPALAPDSAPGPAGPAPKGLAPNSAKKK